MFIIDAEKRKLEGKGQHIVGRFCKHLRQRQNVRSRTASMVSMWSIWERNLRFVFQWACGDDEEDIDDNRFVLCQYACWNFSVTFFRHETHDNSHIGICTSTISITCYFLFDLFYLVLIFSARQKLFWIWRSFFFIFTKAIISQSLILCVCFLDRCLSFCLFFLWSLCCLSSIYSFWLPLW